MDVNISIPDDVASILTTSKGNYVPKLVEGGLSEYQAKFYSKLWNMKRKKIKSTKKSTRNIKNPKTIYEDENEVEMSKEFQQDKASVLINSLTISTIDQGLEVAKVDLDKWEIDRAVVNTWQSTLKLKDSNGNEYPETRTNYQVKIKLKARVKNTIEETLKALFKKLPENPTKYPKLPKKPKPELMLELGLVDHHFGLLAWGKETLSNYDLKIAEMLYVEATKKVLEKIKNPEQIGKILLPVGNDFFHINDQTNQTPRAKHMLDVDGRLPKVYSVGKYAVIKTIEYCRKLAPVEVIFVSGNHDPQMAYYLCDTIASWYKDCPDVIVDMNKDIVNPTSRKYRRWGKSMVGFSHGLDEKVNELPLIMAAEQPLDWAKSIYREVHTGHYHKTKSKWFLGGDTHNPVVVRTLPSLSGSDSYSYNHGWLAKGTQMIESYLWDKNYGMVSFHTVKKEEICDE